MYTCIENQNKKNDRYAESESKSESVMHFGSRRFGGKEEEERRRSMFRNAWGACLGLGLFFFGGGGGACFFLWFTYDAASKRIKALPNREQ